MYTNYTAQPITAGNPKSDILVLMFHGYSSAPRIFEYLVKKCVQRLNAYVIAPVVLGHNTDLHELPEIHFNDFIAYVDGVIHGLARDGHAFKKIVVVGDCFGSYLATRAAQKLRADCLVLTTVPYILRFPLNIKIVQWLASKIRFLPKLFRNEQHPPSPNTFYWIPGNVLSMIECGNAFMRRTLPRLESPVLAINLHDDPASAPESASTVAKLAHNRSSRGMTLASHEHIVHTSGKYLFAEEYILYWIEQTLQIDAPDSITTRSN